MAKLKLRGLRCRVFEMLGKGIVVLLELLAPADHDISSHLRRSFRRNWHAPLADIGELVLQDLLLAIPALLRRAQICLSCLGGGLVLSHSGADLFELGLDFGESLDVLGVGNKLSLVLVVRILRKLSLATHVVLRSELGFAGALVGGPQIRDPILKGLSLLLEGDPLHLDLAVELRVLVVGRREMTGDLVEAFAQAL